jgi:hypothetical protein
MLLLLILPSPKVPLAVVGNKRLDAPPGTPREPTERLAAEVNRALADTSLRSALDAWLVEGSGAWWLLRDVCVPRSRVGTF